MSEKKMRAAAYCRVSTKDEEQLKSFEHQKQIFDRLFDGSEEYELHRVYEDRGRTGTKINRPDFDDMIRDAGIDKSRVDKSGYFVRTGKPEFEIILVKNTSRFARHDATTMLLQSLLNNGVDVKFMDTNTRASDPNADMILGLMSVVDKAESKDKSRRTSTGMWQGAKNKTILCNSKIYGYEYKPLPENRLIIVEEEAVNVRRMFKLYADDVGAHKIADILNQDGVRNRSGKPFAECTIRNMLANEKYCGIVARMKYDTGEIFKERKRKIRPIEERVEYQFENADKMPAIISKELFDNVQDIRKNRIQHMTQVGTHKGSSKYGYRIFCATCGKQYRATALIPYGDRKERYYRCVGKQGVDRETRCENPNVSDTFLDNELKSEKYAEILAESLMSALRVLVELQVDLIQAIEGSDTNEKLSQLETEHEQYMTQMDAIMSFEDLGSGAMELARKKVKAISEKDNKVLAKIDALSKPMGEKKYDVEQIEESIDELKRRLCEIYDTGAYSFEYSAELGYYMSKDGEDDIYDVGTQAPKRQFTHEEILKDIERIEITSNKNLIIRFKTFAEVEELVKRHEFIMTDRMLGILEEERAAGFNRSLSGNGYDFLR